MKRGIFLIALFVLLPVASAELSYYHYDLQGNVRHITNSNGNVIEESKYLPFGERFDSDMKDVHGFTGKELDNSNNYYFNARYQSPQEGRFLTPDTVKPDLENPQSLNLYTYTLNNPIKYIDPSGNDKYSVDQLYVALVSQETPEIMGEDAFVFTKGKPSDPSLQSSAYGPVQMARIKIRETRGYNIEWTDSEKKYIEKFVQQATDRLKGVYKGGDRGRLYGKEDRKMYEQVAKKIIDYEYNIISEGNLDKFIEMWRGFERGVPVEFKGKSYWYPSSKVSNVKKRGYVKMDELWVKPTETRIYKGVKMKTWWDEKGKPLHIAPTYFKGIDKSLEEQQSISYRD